MFDCLLIVSPFQVFLMQYRHDILQQVLPELLELPWEVLRVDSQYDYPNEHPPDAASALVRVPAKPCQMQAVGEVFHKGRDVPVVTLETFVEFLVLPVKRMVLRHFRNLFLHPFLGIPAEILVRQPFLDSFLGFHILFVLIKMVRLKCKMT